MFTELKINNYTESCMVTLPVDCFCPARTVSSHVLAERELDFENVVAEKDSMIMEKFVYAMEMRLDPELKSNGFNSGCFAEAHRNASHNRISE